MRRPQPLLKQRMPSGRGAMEQPNITSHGAGVLTPRFWVMVVLTGIAAGLLGALMMADLVQRAVRGVRLPRRQPAARRGAGIRGAAGCASLLIAGVFGGVAWFLLRRYTKGEPSEIDEAVWNGDGRLSFRRCLGTSVISEVVIGMGASIGREAAPKLLGGASGSVLAGWGGLSAQQRRLLVACGGGAGLAAVYNVPLAGALFTAEILIGSITLPVMLPAIACSCDRDRHGVDIPARPRHLPRHPRLPLHLVGDDLGAAGRAGHRADLGRVHPAHRLGLASPRPGHHGRCSRR